MLMKATVLFLLVGLMAFRASAADVPVRNYPSGLTLERGRFEISLDYLQMNATVDVFDFRESRMERIDASAAGNSLGDLSGGRLMAAYGLSDRLMLAGQYVYRALDVGSHEVEIDSYELALHHKRTVQRAPGLYLFYAGGVRYDQAGDQRTSDIGEIDQLVGRIDSDLSVSSSPGRVNLTDGSVTISSPVVNRDGTPKDPLTVNLHDNYDYSLYIRGGIGKTWDRINLALFTEIGHTAVRGALGHNFALYGVDEDVSRLTEFDPDFDRSENFAKAGIDLQVRPFRKVFANLVYFYQIMDRDPKLDFIDYNHVVQGDLIYRITTHLAVNLGAEYYYRQFNGIIPLLYNQYTRTTFDHDYAVVHCGLTLTL